MPTLFCNVSLTRSRAANTPFQQGGTSNSPIQAIPAAISTKTSLLLGLWASAGDANFANEIAALKSAIATYGSQLGGLVAGISVGSEDLYRISPTGILNKENPGVGPDVLAGYIKQVRDAIAGTPLSGAPVGHVDTWTAWVNSSNDAVISASDFLGVDAYPYFQVCSSPSRLPCLGISDTNISAKRPQWQTRSLMAQLSSTTRSARPKPPPRARRSG